MSTNSEINFVGLLIMFMIIFILLCISDDARKIKDLTRRVDTLEQRP